MKWLIYGGKGWIGSQVVELLKQDETNELYLPETRLDDTENVIETLNHVKPDRVICLIGRTSGPGFGTIDYLEQKGKLYENIRDNMFSPVALAELCRQRSIHLTYLGTGCIFTYDEDHRIENRETELFTENDRPNYFDSSYSVVKGYTDRLMHLYDATCLNIRIRMPITHMDHSRNFVSKIIRYQKVISIANSMTVLDELLPVMLKCSKEAITGTLNLCNPGTITHNEILDLYKEYVDPSFTYQNFSEEELLKVTACGRSNNALSTERLEKIAKEFGLQVSPIREAIVQTMKTWR